MKQSDFYSVRNHFVFDRERSQTFDDSWFFQYLHTNEKWGEEAKVFVIIDKEKICFKLEAVGDITQTQTQTKLYDLLVVPKNIEHRSFLGVEAELVRQKGIIKELLLNFIEDLYVHQYFKETGNTQELKSALENVPLIKGAVCAFLFKHYRKKCVPNSTDERWKRDYWRERFEDAYLNYSRFLSEPQNERLFQRGGWFFNSSKKGKDIDSRLYNLERHFLKVEQRLEASKNLFSEPKNITHILKRYGVFDVLRLSFPRWLYCSYVWSLCLLVGLIVCDVAVFNLEGNVVADYAWLVDRALLVVTIVFVIVSICIGVISLFKSQFKSKIFPGIFLPRLMIAIFSGWLVFFTAEDLLKVDLNINATLLLFMAFIILTITFVFMVFEMRNYAPAMSRSNVAMRSGLVIGLAFVASYSIGFWVMTHLNQKFMMLNSPFVNLSEFKFAFDKREQDYKDIIDNLKKRKQDFNNVRMKESCDNYTVVDKTLSIATVKFDLQDKQILSKIKVLADYDSKLEEEVGKFNLQLNLLKEQRLNYQFYQLSKRLANGSIHPLAEMFLPEPLRQLRVWADNPDKAVGCQEFDHLDIANNLERQLSSLKSPNEYMQEYIREGGEIVINRQRYRAKIYDFFGQDYVTFPNMLLSRALLAMFVGIFLQLIIQEKTITEPI